MISSLALPGASVTIEWDDPSQYVDFSRSDRYRERDAEFLKEELTNAFEKHAASALPEDASLAITVHNVDLAGDFEPWLGHRFNDVRILRDRYPPAMVISYTLTAAGGSVLASAERERLIDTTLGFRPAGSRSDPYVYDKELIRDFIRGLKRKVSNE